MDLIESINILGDLTLESKVLSKVNVWQSEQHDCHVDDEPVVYKRGVVDLSHSVGRQVVNGATEDNAINKQLNNG